MKNFVPQSSLALHNNRQAGPVCTKSSNTIIYFVKESNGLYFYLSPACFQALKTKKQHLQNFYFRLLGYNAVYALQRKEYDIEVETPGPFQTQNARKVITK